MLHYLYAYILNNINIDVSNGSSPPAPAVNGGSSPMVPRSYSKYSVSSKIKKVSGDLYSLDAIIDKSNIELLKATFQFKINDKSIFNDLQILAWIENEL